MFYHSLPHNLNTSTIFHHFLQGHGSYAPGPGPWTQAISYTAALEASETKTEQWMTTLQLLQEVIEGGMALTSEILGWHGHYYSKPFWLKRSFDHMRKIYPVLWCLELNRSFDMSFIFPVVNGGNSELGLSTFAKQNGEPVRAMN